MDCSLPGSSVHGIFQARVMADGVICEEGTPQEVFDNPQNERTQDFLRKVL